MLENFSQHFRNDGEGQLGVLKIVVTCFMPIRFYWVTHYTTNYITNANVNSIKFSEQEKRRRWGEIKVRQHRLMSEMVEAQATAPAHIDHIMKSGFTMNDIKGLHRNYTEDAEGDDQMMRMNPPRPPRRGSLTQNGYDSMDMNVKMPRSTSALNMERYQSEERTLEGEKKRGRSPFSFFKKSRDHSKDKLKSKSKSPDAMDRRRKC